MCADINSDVCYECGQPDCPDFLAGHAPGRDEVSRILNETIANFNPAVKGMTLAELRAHMRKLSADDGI